MPVFEIQNKRYTFIHIPKTGGTSVEEWLASLGEMHYYSPVIPSFMKCTPQHLTADYLKLLNPIPSDKSFCIVRDPYARAESEYKYRHPNVNHINPPDFSIWMLSHLDAYNRNKHHRDNHFLPQAYFVNSEIKCFRFEDGFRSIFKDISEYLGIATPGDVNYLNKSEGGELTWSNELLDRFNNIYGCDFEAFGYSKKSITKTI